jgi:transcriptional regulator with XRE-family HTH domain
MSTFGDRLRDLRTKRNISQKELANQFQISESAIGMYERGKREPSFALVEKISSFFGVSTDYLLAGRVSEQTSPYNLLNDPELNIAFYDGFQDLTPEEQEAVKENVRNMIMMFKRLKAEQATKKNK